MTTTTTADQRPKVRGTTAADRSVRRAHPLRSEFLRGSAPLTGAVVFVVLAVVMASKASEWQGGWSETQALSRTASALIAASLAGAAGCWQGQREHRRRTGELLGASVRPPLSRFLLSALPTAVWAAGAQLIVAGGCLLATRLYAFGGEPVLSMPLADAAFTASIALLGHVAGSLSGRRLLAPAFGVLVYTVFGLLSMLWSDGPAGQLNPIAAEGTMAGGGSFPVWWQPLATTAWIGGLAATAVLARAARRRASALLPLTVAVVSAALVAQTGDRMWQPNPLAQRQVCDTSIRPAICLEARYAGLLPEVKAGLSKLTGRLEGVGHLPERFENLSGPPRPGEAQLPMLMPLGRSVVRGRLIDEGHYTWAAALALVRPSEKECTARDEDRRAALVDEVVIEWLGPQPVSEFDDHLLESAEQQGDQKKIAEIKAEKKAFDTAYGRLRDMGDQERREWLSDFFAATWSCDPSEVPAL